MVKKRREQRAKSEMNVVPYIDVMLVLLVIFMISAPLLSQSVEIDLPNLNNATEIKNKDNEEIQPLIVSIDRNGAYYIDRSNDNLPINKNLIISFTKKALAKNAKTPIYIRADKKINYGAVMQVMDMLKSAGADSVGLITTKDQ